MAEVGDDVVLVEADLRKESSFRYGNGYVHDGLSGVLSGTPLDAALIQIPVTHDRSQERSLNVLPCGPIPPNPSELLESGKMVEIVEELKSRFGMILIDSPAIGVVGDATSLVPLCSAMVVVGGVGRTTREGAKGFVDQLELVGSRPLGLVATFTNTSRKQYSYYRRTSPLAR
jgi:capsular exopolysaccharide synthesis family protein